MNKIEIFSVGGKNYTEDELLLMINHYNNTHATVPILNEDTLKEIMYNSDSNTLKQYCLTNKAADKLCANNNFWKTLFYKQNLPFLYEISNENLKMINKKIHIETEPESMNEWIKLYGDTIYYMNIATKLVNNIIKTNTFTQFSAPYTSLDSLLWLPNEWFKTYTELLKTKLFFEQDITYSVNPGFDKEFRIILFFLFDDYDIEEKLESIYNLENEINLSKIEFITYIAKLIYNHHNYSKDQLFLIEDTDGGEMENFITLNDLQIKATKNMKTIFPNW